MGNRIPGANVRRAKIEETLRLLELEHADLSEDLFHVSTGAVDGAVPGSNTHASIDVAIACLRKLVRNLRGLLNYEAYQPEEGEAIDD